MVSAVTCAVKDNRWQEQFLIGSRQLPPFFRRCGHLRTPTQVSDGFLNTNQKMYPSAPASAYAHIGNGTNAIYVDSEHDIVAVVKWMDDKSMDGFLKLLLSALPNK